MSKLQVEVVTPERVLASREVDEVIAPGERGLFGVRPGHMPFLSLLKAGPLVLGVGTTQERFFVTGGFAEVTGERVRIVAEGAEEAQAIDVAAAQKRMAEAQGRLLKVDPASETARLEQAIISLEAVRIEVARKAAT